MQTVQEIYEREVVLLPFADRLRLASFILRDVTQFPASVSPAADESTEWSEQDMREWSDHGRNRFGEEEESVADTANG